MKGLTGILTTGSKGPRRLPSIGRLWATAFLGIGVLLAITVAAQFLLSWGAERQRSTLVLQQAAELEADGLGRQFGDLRSLLMGLVQDPHLIPRVIRFTDPSAVSALEASLARLIPGALGVRLLPPGHSAVDAKSSPPLSFAALDLLRKAERAMEPVPLEVHLVGTPDQHLATAIALRGEGENVVGVLRLAFRDSLSAVPKEVAGGKLVLQQQVRGQWANLDPASAGPAEPEGAVNIPTTTLRVGYWRSPSDAMAELGRDTLVFLALIGATGLVLRRVATRLSQDVRHDEVAVADLADALSRTGLAPAVSLRLQDSREVVERWLQKQGYSEVAKYAAQALPELPDVAIEQAPECPATPGRETGMEPRRHGLAEETLAATNIPESIFGAYDIRGLVGSGLTEGIAAQLGRAIGSEAAERGQTAVILGRDTRGSSEALARAVAAGLCDAGVDVIDLGVVPSPLVYFATRYLGTDAGVMVTASHNPPEYNGFKVIIGGVQLGGEDLKRLHGRLVRGELLRGSGRVREQALIPDYVQQIANDVSLARSLRVVVDCGGGTTVGIAPEVVRRLGCVVTAVDCEGAGASGEIADTTQPAHLGRLMQRVLAEGADLGAAFDEDGDRLGVVDSSGKIIWIDRVLMVLATDLLSRQPGSDILFDVKCSRHLSDLILEYGGRPLMVKSGHTTLKAELRATGAPLGGEWSGHILFQDRWYGFDDAVYAAARLLEILALDPRPTSEVFASFPEAVSTPELMVPMPEGSAAHLIERLVGQIPDLGQVSVSTLDGLRLEFPNGWGLVRASNTQPALVFRFEGDTEAALEQVQQSFRDLFRGLAPELALPF